MQTKKEEREMSDQSNRLVPEQLPFQIEEDLGEILLAEQPYPDVYYVVAKEEETSLLPKEYYVVLKDTQTISQAVKKYGKGIPGYPELLLYPLSEDKSGWRLVDYEGLRYLTQNRLQMPEQKSLHDTAVYSMEYHPEYFGTYPVPAVTPAGYMLRYKTLDNGIYWLETDLCKQFLSVCYPIWSSELSETALSLGQQAEYDQTHGIDKTLGCLFFSEHDSCIPLFELLQLRRAWENLGCINGPALMNAVWKDFPEYAATHNLREQSGANDFLGRMLKELGADVDLNGSAKYMIAMSPQTDTDFICW